eukprot:6195685-Pyramimonas_sp.AAC.1
MGHWQSLLNPDASHDTVVDGDNTVVSTDRAERASRPMAVFFRACQGHSPFVHSAERMRAPCEFGMARSHGHVLHVASLETIKESTIGSGSIRCPNKLSGLRAAPDYELLRLIPTR